jgi:carboxymethylenebutenolidase
MFAASKAASRDMEKISFGPSKDIPGYVAGPKGAPAVLVIQEWWGVTDEIREHASVLAGSGYRVLVPDLYKGKIGVDAEEAHHMMGHLDFPGAIVEIGHGAAFLKAEGSAKVGVMGFCMGGALALGSAAACKDISCVAAFYGVNMGLFTPDQLASKPVRGHFGEEDSMKGFADPDTARALEAALLAAGNDKVKVTIHPKVGHAFMNTTPSPFKSFEERQEKLGFPPYDKQTAYAAWADTLGFFSRHLVMGL